MFGFRLVANQGKRPIEAVDEEVTTVLGSPETFSFTWKIQNISGFQKGTEVTSPIMTSQLATPHKWQLTARLSQNDQVHGNESLGLFLSLLNFGDKPFFLPWFRKLPVAFQISFVDGQGQSFGGVGDMKTTVQFKRNYKYGSATCISTFDLMTPLKIPDDTLHIRCDIRWYKGEPRHYVDGNRAEGGHGDTGTHKRIRQDVADAVAALRSDVTFADLDVTSSGYTFKAHKAILLSRSSDFAGRLDSNGKTLNLTEFCEGVVNATLDYVYLGEAAESEVTEYAAGLVHLAETFQLVELKQVAESSLIRQTSERNIGEMILLAHTNKATNLMTKVEMVIKATPFIKTSQSYRDFKQNNPQIFVHLNLDKPSIFN